MESFVDTGLRVRVVDAMVALLPQILGRDLPTLSEETGLVDELALSST